MTGVTFRRDPALAGIAAPENWYQAFDAETGAALGHVEKIWGGIRGLEHNGWYAHKPGSRTVGQPKVRGEAKWFPTRRGAGNYLREQAGLD